MRLNWGPLASAPHVCIRGLAGISWIALHWWRILIAMRFATLFRLGPIRIHYSASSISALPCRPYRRPHLPFRYVTSITAWLIVLMPLVPFSVIAEDSQESFSGANEMVDTRLVQISPKATGRASSKQVGTIMALLATFEDAGALPPESSPDANRLIKALIQFQAAFMKSTDPAITQLLTDALTMKLGDQAPADIARFHATGWTSESLEALVEFIANHKSWQQPDVRTGFRTYNVGEEDFALLANTFVMARRNLADRGHDLHTVYASRRREMPGAGS